MSEGATELRSIAWLHAFPFTRLFRTFSLAVRWERLITAFACIIAIVIVGTVLDWVWLGLGGGAVVNAQGDAHAIAATEVQAYATLPRAEFGGWVADSQTVRAAHEESLKNAEKALKNPDGSQTLTLDLALSYVDEGQQRRWEKEIGVVKKWDDPAERRAIERDIIIKADAIRLALYGYDYRRLGVYDVHAAVKDTFDPEGTADPVATAEAAQRQNSVNRYLALVRAECLVDASKPRGPFRVFIEFECRCVAGALRGVASGEWGFHSGVNSDTPSFLGCCGSAARGLAWIVTRRPVFSLLLGLAVLFITAFGGGAICRHAAVETTRDEVIGFAEMLTFARDKWRALTLGAALPLALIIAIGVVVGLVALVLGILSMIPGLGGVFTVLAGFLSIIAIVAGVVAAVTAIGYALCFHLIWPTIAFEGSDAFDAISRAFGYVKDRIWHSVFYTGVLTIYGALCLVFVRLLAMVSFKLAHSFSDAGLSVFGWNHSAKIESVGKMDAMWTMPGWGELSLLPTTYGKPFWGEFGVLPTSYGEAFGGGFAWLWVHLAVALVAAVMLSFFFCGSSQIYLLLRRQVDAVDYDDIYYEEPELEPTPTPAANAEGDESSVS